MKKILLFAGFLWLLLYPPYVRAINPPFQDDFNFTWTYLKIFGPENIPLPTSVQGANNPRVAAVYSPSVIKISSQYLMFFGVSIYCTTSEGDIARDSIALARSNDGNNWVFDKYIIEPDIRSCFLPPSQWDNFTYQVNDPAVYLDPDGQNKLSVFYTSVVAHKDNFGHIGLAIFDLTLNLLSRNDTFLTGTNKLSPYGYSRPTVAWNSLKTSRLWFDSGGKAGSVSLTFNPLSVGTDVQDENLSATNINIPLLEYDQQLLLFDGAPSLWAKSRSSVFSSWATPWHIIASTGQGWDSSYQGSPDLFLDPQPCDVKLYFAGAVLGGSYSGYSNLSIGVAIPPPEKHFSFPICSNTLPSVTPTPTLLPSISLKAGWNRILWQTVVAKEAGQLPISCRVADNKKGLFLPYVLDFWPGSWSFTLGNSYFIYCASSIPW